MSVKTLSGGGVKIIWDKNNGRGKVNFYDTRGTRGEYEIKDIDQLNMLLSSLDRSILEQMLKNYLYDLL